MRSRKKVIGVILALLGLFVIAASTPFACWQITQSFLMSTFINPYEMILKSLIFSYQLIGVILVIGSVVIITKED